MKILKSYNPFVYPGGNPGFDPNHLASGPNLFSVVAVTNGANCISVLQGKRGTVNGTPSQIIDGILGPLYSTTLNQSQGTTFTNFSTATNGTATMAGIFKFPATPTSIAELISDNGSAFQFRVDNSNPDLNFVYSGFTSVNAGFTLSANVPYFAAGSSDTSTSVTNFILCRLDNGKTITSVKGGSNSVNAMSGTWNVGDLRTSGGADGGLQIAAGMFSSVKLSQAHLIQWAADPWSFWYPRTQRQLIFSSIGGAVTTTTRPWPPFQLKAA